INSASRVVLWLAAVAVTGFALAPDYIGPIAAAFVRSPATSAVKTERSDATPITATIRIPSMDCTACEAPIKAVLMKTPGVQSVDVSYKRGDAVVKYDPAQIDIRQIKEAITSTGFEAK